jgi:hypothetical protein
MRTLYQFAQSGSGELRQRKGLLMLNNAKALKGYKLAGIDGRFGKVKRVLF